MKKTRLDAELVRQELAANTDEAKRLIMAGKVLVDDQRIEKPGTLIKPDSLLRIKGKKQRFASRAGEKLEGALQHFSVSVEGLTALDLGASTGGFTDCLLQYGAQKVFTLSFDAALSSQSPETFMAHTLKKELGLAGVVAGAEHAFVNLSETGICLRTVEMTFGN